MMVVTFMCIIHDIGIGIRSDGGIIGEGERRVIPL